MPGNRPLASATAFVEVTVGAPSKQNIHHMDAPAVVAFAKGPQALLSLGSEDSYSAAMDSNTVLSATTQMPASDTLVGKALTNLLPAEYIQVEVRVIGSDKLVVGGKVVLVINGSLRGEFQIPPQKELGNRIFVRNIGNTLADMLR